MSTSSLPWRAELFNPVLCRDNSGIRKWPGRRSRSRELHRPSSLSRRSESPSVFGRTL